MHFSSTDLPVPEPPITTIDSPGATSRSIPCNTFLGPKALVTPRNEILGDAMGGAGQRAKKASVMK